MMGLENIESKLNEVKIRGEPSAAERQRRAHSHEVGGISAPRLHNQTKAALRNFVGENTLCRP